MIQVHKRKLKREILMSKDKMSQGKLEDKKSLKCDSPSNEMCIIVLSHS
jgi:hypothetical protein